VRKSACQEVLANWQYALIATNQNANTSQITNTDNFMLFSGMHFTKGKTEKQR